MDFVTFVGSGEPTLFKDLKELILKARECTKKPICVITNGALLYDLEVMEALLNADIVIPTLDAGDRNLFIKINRPHPKLKYDKIINGLVNFSREFSGKLWIEIMLIKEINTAREELLKIKDKIDIINPERIDINVPIRSPTENWVEIPGKSTLSVLNEIFDGYNYLNVLECGIFHTYSSDFENELLSIIQRHPMREEQIIETFLSERFTRNEIILKLEELESRKKINKWTYNGKIYWKLM